MSSDDVVRSAFNQIYEHFYDLGRVITYINYQRHGNIIIGFWEKNTQRGGFVEYHVNSVEVEGDEN